jgi:arsenate reductase-like glutaredoxin family protein
MDDSAALDIIVEQPTLFKRPLLDIGHERHCGFSAASYQDIFNHHTL